MFGKGTGGSPDRLSILLLKISYFLLFGSHGSFETYLSVFFNVKIKNCVIKAMSPTCSTFRNVGTR